MRTHLFLLGAIALLALGGCATNQSGLVIATDDWDDTIRIGDELYHVTPDTMFFGPDGQRIQLWEVPKLSDPGIGVRHSQRAEVDFWASEHDGRRTLERLQVLKR